MLSHIIFSLVILDNLASGVITKWLDDDVERCPLAMASFPLQLAKPSAKFELKKIPY